MSIPQILTDEQAAAIWSGESASILNFETKEPEKVETSEEVVEESTKTETTKTATPAKAEKKEEVEISDDELTNVWAEEDDDNDDDEGSSTASATPSTDTKPKSGRKASDLVTMVNQLVEEELLFGFEDGEIKTIEEAKELIKENLKYKEDNSVESAWQKKVSEYSPQIQAILHYAEKGGQDITTLLNAISDVERSVSTDIEQEAGQEEIVRQVLKIKGFDDEEIADQIETLKDLDKLKQKAEKFLPQLNRMKEERIQMMLAEQEEREAQAQEAAKIYIDTIQSTLNKERVGDLSLKKEDKYKILEALAVPRYRSINGFEVNEFVKSLEELQFGKNADYDHFLNVVHFTIDKQGFIEKLKESIRTEVTGETVKRLKTAKSSGSNSSTELGQPQTPAKRNTISRGGFKNPYAK